MMMTFDSGAAWDDAVRMLRANKDVLAIVGAVFFFLPALAQVVLTAGDTAEVVPEDLDQIVALMTSDFTSNWLIIVLTLIASFVGSIAIYALLGKTSSPTVGEAIGVGLKMLPTYIAFTLIFMVALAVAIAPMALLGLGAGLGILGVILSLALLFVFLVISVRMALVGAIFGIEETTNPVDAIKASWKMVKGNTLSVFLFMLLIGIAAGVIMLIAGWLAGLIGGMAGATFGLWFTAAINGLVSTVFTVLMLSVYTAIYKQLSGADTSAADVFD